VELGSQDSVNKRNTGFFGAATGVMVSAANPIAVATRFAPNTTDADNKVTSGTFAVYAQDQVTLTSQWKMLAGLRYDRFAVKFDDRRVLVPAVDLKRTDTAFSPRAALIWSPDAKSSYYASYSYAFLPSGEQLSLAATISDLAPEIAKNFEAGARWDLLPALTLSTAVFRTYRDNVRVTDPSNPTNFIKSGQQLTDGFEIGLQGDVTKDWQVYGGYASLDGRVTKPLNTGTTTGLAAIVPAGNKLPLVPNKTLSLWNKFQLGAGWGTGVGMVYQGESFAAIDNTVKLPSFARLDGAVYYAFANGKTRLALNLENILNRKYFPTVDGNNNISPGSPLNARLTLSTSF
jgi:catecholate siderophore receptor